MRTAGQQTQHACSVGGIRRFAENFVVADNRGIRRQDRSRDNAARGNNAGCSARLVVSHAQYVIVGMFSSMRGLVDIGAAPRPLAQWNEFKGHADLPQQFVSSRTAGSEINRSVIHGFACRSSIAVIRMAREQR